MAKKLSETRYKWTRQAMWGYRLFDFWNHELGIAVEVDGPEHDAEYDNYRDRYNYYRSALLVLRVKNFDEAEAARALGIIDCAETWAKRKEIVKPGKTLLRANGFEMARSPTKKEAAA